MIKRKTVIDQIEITRGGAIQVRFGLLLVENGMEAGQSDWHRTIIEPGVDPDAQIGAVNQHLRAMGKPEIDHPQMIYVLKNAVANFHTPERVAAWQDKARQDEELAISKGSKQSRFS